MHVTTHVLYERICFGRCLRTLNVSGNASREVVVYPAAGQRDGQLASFSVHLVHSPPPFSFLKISEAFYPAAEALKGSGTQLYGWQLAFFFWVGATSLSLFHSHFSICRDLLLVHPTLGLCGIYVFYLCVVVLCEPHELQLRTTLAIM